MENYGYNDLAGQFRSPLDLPRDVHLVPFFVVALLVIAYILLIGPGDFFLLRRLGRGMQWTWITFPTIVVLFAVGGLPGRLLAEGRPASRQPGRSDRYRRRGHGPRRQLVQHLQSAGRIVRPLHAAPPARWPTAQGDHASLAWFGKAGDQFNGMYGRGMQNSTPLWSQGYSIAWSPDATSPDAIRSVPIQVWASKSFVQCWLGQAPDLGLDASLKG